MDNRMFPKSVMDQIQFHEGNEPIMVMAPPKLDVDSCPCKNLFDSILPRPKPIHLSKQQVQELERLMKTPRQYVFPWTGITMSHTETLYNKDYVK